MYLLFLQGIRQATGGVFDEFFNAISKLAVDILPLLAYVVFWAASKKWGWRFLWGIWSGEVVNSLIKLTACAYRPWIRSDKIEPAGDSKVAATGYSFPSRHTVYGTQLYGNTIAWQKNKRRWLAILCGVLLALTGFSRNFLGAPELPVLAAVGVGIILAWEKLFEPATIVLLLGTHWGNLLARFISIIFGVVIWPMVIRREVRRGAELRARERAGGAAHGI